MKARDFCHKQTMGAMMSLIICSNDFDTFTLRSPISRIQTLSSQKLLQCSVLFAFSGFCVGVVNGHWSFNAKMEVDDLYSPLTRQCVLLWLIMEKKICLPRNADTSLS